MVRPLECWLLCRTAEIAPIISADQSKHGGFMVAGPKSRREAFFLPCLSSNVVPVLAHHVSFWSGFCAHSQVAGFELQRRYGSAFDKVVQTIKTEVLPILLPKTMVGATRNLVFVLSLLSSPSLLDPVSLYQEPRQKSLTKVFSRTAVTKHCRSVMIRETHRCVRLSFFCEIVPFLLFLTGPLASSPIQQQCVRNLFCLHRVLLLMRSCVMITAVTKFYNAVPPAPQRCRRSLTLLAGAASPGRGVGGLRGEREAFFASGRERQGI